MACFESQDGINFFFFRAHSLASNPMLGGPLEAELY